MRRFNRSGPIVAKDHYHVPPLSRVNLDEIRELIADKQYFVLHAPRQTGKTTALLSLQRLLNEEDRYRCVYVNIEGAQAMRENVEEAVRMILGQTALQARLVGDDFLSDAWSGIWTEYGPGALSECLARWSLASDKPLVLLVDEIDSLVGDSLLAVLRQLRASHHLRPEGFPQCVVLCGVRDVRDYRIHSGSANTMIAGGSAFQHQVRVPALGQLRPSTSPRCCSSTRRKRASRSAKTPSTPFGVKRWDSRSWSMRWPTKRASEATRAGTAPARYPKPTFWKPERRSSFGATRIWTS